MLRLIFWLPILYLVYYLLKRYFGGSTTQRPHVQGKPKSKPLDLDDNDVIDANFREIKDETKREQD